MGPGFPARRRLRARNWWRPWFLFCRHVAVASAGQSPDTVAAAGDLSMPRPGATAVVRRIGGPGSNSGRERVGWRCRRNVQWSRWPRVRSGHPSRSSSAAVSPRLLFRGLPRSPRVPSAAVTSSSIVRSLSRATSVGSPSSRWSSYVRRTWT